MGNRTSSSRRKQQRDNNTSAYSDRRRNEYTPEKNAGSIPRKMNYQSQTSTYSNGVNSTTQSSASKHFSLLFFLTYLKFRSVDKLIYVANYDFNGTSSTGELSFRKNDQLEILDRYSYNDWWQAKNLRTKQIGYVPANYISAKNDLTACEYDHRIDSILFCVIFLFIQMVFHGDKPP